MKAPNGKYIKRADDVLTSLEMEMIETMYSVKCVASKIDHLDQNPHLSDIERDLKIYMADQYPNKNM